MQIFKLSKDGGFNTKKKLLNGLAILLMMVMMYSNYAMASSGSSSVTVGTECIFKTGVSRTTDYNYVRVRADSVYPVGNYDKDNYTKCKTAIYKNDNTSTRISNIYTLTEGHGYSNVEIYNGNLSLAKVNICFAGNDPALGAVIDFSYDGK